MNKAFLTLLLLTLPALAVPNPDAARTLVNKIIGYSLENYKQGLRIPAPFKATASHPEDFAPEYFKLMNYFCLPSGRSWVWEMDPIWAIQLGGIEQLKIGAAKVEGTNLLFPVTYYSPNPISSLRPGTHYANLWIITESNGKPVLQDVRYSGEFTGGHRRSVLEELRKAKADNPKGNQK